MRLLLVMGAFLINCTSFADSEALFYNFNEDPRYCYFNENGCIERREVQPGGSCGGDAFGTLTAVFKVPDYTTFYCEDQCRPDGTRSRVIFQLAGMRKGWEHYGAMSMDQFMRIMGNQQLCSELDQYRLPTGYDEDPDVVDSGP